MKITVRSTRGGGRGTIGMPLGNLTSQFFANVYLNELDQFVKHKLKIKYYVRYVDDFVILHENKKLLRLYKKLIKGTIKVKLRTKETNTASKYIEVIYK